MKLCYDLRQLPVTRSIVLLPSVLVAALVLIPSAARPQRFGLGMLKSERTVTLHRKLPATVNLKKGVIGIKATSQDSKNAAVVQKLVDTLQTELVKYNNQFKLDDNEPDVLVSCNITDLLIPGTKIAFRTTTSLRVGKGAQPHAQTQKFQEITGRLNVAYQVQDTRGGQILDADNLVAEYSQEFDAGGNNTGDLNIISIVKKKSSEEKAGDTPPTPAELQQILVRKIVLQIAERLTNTDENVEVRLARGSELDQYSALAEKGLWNRYLESLETMKPLDTKGEDAFRLYNIGVAYEALAYEAEDSRNAKKYLNEAAVNYGKAVDANVHEKDFLGAQNRIAIAQAHYAKLDATAAPVAKSNSGVSAQHSPFERAPKPAAGDGPLTNDQIIELARAGLDEDNLVAIIKGAPKVKFDMTANGLTELVKAGVKGKVLRAAEEAAKTVAEVPPLGMDQGKGSIGLSRDGHAIVSAPEVPQNEVSDKANVAKPEKPSDDDLLEDSLNRLRKGNLAYSTPDKMKTGQTQHVTARIAGEKISVSALEADVPAGKDLTVATVATPVSTKMKMTLKSADFDITPLSSEEQIVAGETPTTWEWDIVPKHSGKLRLHLAAVVEIKQLSKDFATVDRDITVHVDPVDATEKFVQMNWQWIIATMTALGGAGWKILRDRKRASLPPPPVAGTASA